MKISFHVTMNFIYKLDIATTVGPAISNVLCSKILIHYSEKSMALIVYFLKSNITSRISKIEMLTWTVQVVLSLHLLS